MKKTYWLCYFHVRKICKQPYFGNYVYRGSDLDVPIVIRGRRCSFHPQNIDFWLSLGSFYLLTFYFLLTFYVIFLFFTYENLQPIHLHIYVYRGSDLDVPRVIQGRRCSFYPPNIDFRLLLGSFCGKNLLLCHFSRTQIVKQPHLGTCFTYKKKLHHSKYYNFWVFLFVHFHWAKWFILNQRCKAKKQCIFKAMQSNVYAKQCKASPCGCGPSVQFQVEEIIILWVYEPKRSLLSTIWLFTLINLPLK